MKLFVSFALNELPKFGFSYTAVSEAPPSVVKIPDLHWAENTSTGTYGPDPERSEPEEVDPIPISEFQPITPCAGVARIGRLVLETNDLGIEEVNSQEAIESIEAAISDTLRVNPECVVLMGWQWLGR